MADLHDQEQHYLLFLQWCSWARHTLPAYLASKLSMQDLFGLPVFAPVRQLQVCQRCMVAITTYVQDLRLDIPPLEEHPNMVVLVPYVNKQPIPAPWSRERVERHLATCPNVIAVR